MINYDLATIKGLVFDVDGVLSLSTIPLIGENGIPNRTANIKDGYALQLAVKRGLHVAIITGGNTPAVAKRYAALGIPHIFSSISLKLPCFQDWLKTVNLCAEEVLYMGDDIPDYEVMTYCGCPCAPKDAAPEIKSIATYISPIAGGMGCVRDVIEQVLKAQNLWMNDAKAFGW